MAFRRHPVQEVPQETEITYDVMALRRTIDHPALEPLMSRRENLLQRQAALRQEQRQAAAFLHDFEHTRALELAEEAPDALAQWGQLKAQVAEADRALGFNEVATRALEEQIDAVVPEVQEDIEARLNRLRLPLVEQVVEHLAAIEQANKELRAIEGRSHILLQQSKPWLVDLRLEGKLKLLRRSLHLLQLATGAEAKDGAA